MVIYGGLSRRNDELYQQAEGEEVTEARGRAIRRGTTAGTLPDSLHVTGVASAPSISPHRDAPRTELSTFNLVA